MKINKKYMLRFLFLVTCIFFFTKGNAQDLQKLIEEALLNNPEIQKFDVKHKRISEKKNEVNTLPNTQIDVGVMAIKPEMGMPMERFNVSLMQMLPWFGTISTREDYVSSLADVAYQDIVIRKRKLKVEVANSYYKLYEINATQKVLIENINLLNIYEKLALTSVEVGKASAVDVLKLQIRKNELQQLKEVLHEQFSGEQTRLNKLLNRKNSKEKINVVDSLSIPKKMIQEKNHNLKLHPELIKYDKLYASVMQSEKVNQKDGKPMLGVGLQYVNMENSSMITSSFKDMIMPMVSVSIPIFNRKYKSTSLQNKLEQEEINLQKQQRYNVLKTELQKAIANQNTAVIAYNTQFKNIAQTKNATQILMRSYETGTIDFNDILDIQELRLKFQLSQIKAVRDYYIQGTIINYLIQ